MEDQEKVAESQSLGEKPTATVKSSNPAKKGWQVWHLMLVIAVSAFFLGIVSPVYLFFDALGHGPYTTTFNQRCQRLADEASLMGRPEGDIIAVLGTPTEIWDYDSGGERKTYNYFPVPFIAAGIFQVHCRSGVVNGVEQLDD